VPGDVSEWQPKSELELARKPASDVQGKDLAPLQTLAGRDITSSQILELAAGV
jgi:hypothetical protein